MNEIKCNTTDQTWHAVVNKDSIWIKWCFEILEKLSVNNNKRNRCSIKDSFTCN